MEDTVCHTSSAAAASKDIIDIPSPCSDSGIAATSEANTPSSEANDSVIVDNLNDGNFCVSSQKQSSKLRQHVNGITATSVIGKGPDVLAPANNYITWNPKEAVKLRTADSGPQAQTPVSVVTAFQQTLARFPDHVALAYKADGKWQEITFKEYYQMVQTAAKAFVKLGLERYHGVGIIGFNSPEWFISDLAAIFAGGLATGIYSTNSPDACWCVADSAECNVIVVDSDKQLQKILKVRHRLPQLRAIVQYNEPLTQRYDNVYTWAEFMSFGAEVPDEVLENRICQLAPNKCCTLIYTSGTTGEPKGVMLSHDNLVWMARNGGALGELMEAAEVFVSYLPLSHVAAQILDIFIPLIYAVTVYFAQPDALKGSLVKTLKEVRPTAFLGVPRVWEKMQESMIAIGRSQWWYKRWIAQWAKNIGLQGNLALMNGGTVPYGWMLSDWLVFRTVRSALGFDRCRICSSAAAPIRKDTLDFFMSLNLPLMEIYGMSETSGPHTMAFPWKYRIVSAGRDITGCHTKIAEPDDDGNGEVRMNGRNVFMGYINMKDQTLEAFDDDLWVRSGDIGKKDDDGFLFITGRIKELLITAGGENVSPILIEDAVREQLPCVSNCMLIGDRRKFLSMLITLKTEVDSKSLPTDRLSPVSLAWCQRVGSNAKTLSHARNDVAIRDAIQQSIDLVNETAVSNAQHIQKWSILPRDFSVPGGELGPTMKLRRGVVLKIYQNTIDAFYEP